MNLKRNNWTNEEVIEILNLCKIDNPPIELEQYNQGLDYAIQKFYEFNVNPLESYSAMAFDTEIKNIVHVGQKLPR